MGLISIAVAVWSIFSFLSGFVRSFVQLLLCRIVIGIGEAGVQPPAIAIISDLYPPNRRGTALAILSVGLPYRFTGGRRGRRLSGGRVFLANRIPVPWSSGDSVSDSCVAHAERSASRALGGKGISNQDAPAQPVPCVSTPCGPTVLLAHRRSARADVFCRGRHRLIHSAILCTGLRSASRQSRARCSASLARYPV